MSEVIPSSPSPPVDDAGTGKSKAGRQSRFSTAEDLVIVREVSAASAHLAAFGETRGKFQEAAGKVNANAVMHEKRGTICFPLKPSRRLRSASAMRRRIALKALVASVTNRKLTGSGSSSEVEEATPLKKKANTKFVCAAPSMDMAAFSLNFRDTDLARVELDRERLQFERERSYADRAERERERRSAAKSAKTCRSLSWQSTSS
eukprot:IDg9483t1